MCPGGEAYLGNLQSRRRLIELAKISRAQLLRDQRDRHVFWAGYQFSALRFFVRNDKNSSRTFSLVYVDLWLRSPREPYLAFFSCVCRFFSHTTFKPHTRIFWGFRMVPMSRVFRGFSGLHFYAQVNPTFPCSAASFGISRDTLRCFSYTAHSYPQVLRR